MTILSSLYSGVSGLTTNGNALSVIGDNIANVNTIGFKNSRASFADVMASSLSGSGRHQIGQGSRLASIDVLFTQGSFQTTTNPTDLAVDGKGFFILQDANGVYYTRAGQFHFDRNGDLINPDGLLVQGYGVDSNGNITGALGNINSAGISSAPNATTVMQLDANIDSRDSVVGSSQTVISGTGAADDATAGNTVLLTVDGVAATVNFAANIANDGDAVAAEIQSDVRATASSVAFDNFTCTWNASTQTYKMVSGTNSVAATSAVVVTGGTEAANLNLTAGNGMTTVGGFDVANALSTSNFSTAMTMYDSLGNGHQVTTYFRKDATNDWSWYAVTAAADNNNGSSDEVQARGSLIYNTSGQLAVQNTTMYPTGGFDFSGGGALDQAIAFDFGTSVANNGTGTDGVTQYGLSSSTSFQSQDGYTSGSSRNISVSSDGIITGLFSNGRNVTIAQIGLASFTSNEGLTRVGGNLFLESVDSGQPSIGQPSSGGRGNVNSNSLEQSTVDLAQEFVNMITTQRGFQANSRTITTTDELLQELINLKR